MILRNLSDDELTQRHLSAFIHSFITLLLGRLKQALIQWSPIVAETCTTAWIFHHNKLELDHVLCSPTKLYFNHLGFCLWFILLLLYSVIFLWIINIHALVWDLSLSLISDTDRIVYFVFCIKNDNDPYVSFVCIMYLELKMTNW